MLRYIRSNIVRVSSPVIVTGVALLFASSQCLAGAKTFASCKSAANASPVAAGQGSSSWLSFCSSLPASSPYKGSCNSQNLESRQAKLGWCGNLENDKGQTASNDNLIFGKDSGRQRSLSGKDFGTLQVSRKFVLSQ
jgi:hypothetical protein